jgi:cyclopropane fatty-acyl-phospholipid synthase-like methyltransferase
MLHKSLKKGFLILFGVFLLNLIHAYEISEKGFWIGEVPECHVTDWKLAEAMVDFLKGECAKEIVDFGCGEGNYVRYFRENNIEAEGYDGNPITPELSKGMCKIQDLSEPFYLGKTFDWVISLEVGEHIPHQYERIFIENLMKHTEKGIILSWAVKNQGGTGHFNEQNNDYIKSVFSNYGYINDIETENKLRDQASIGWFKNTIMVFRKI